MKRSVAFDLGTARECPRCHNTYSTAREDVHEHWYPKKKRQTVIDDAGELTVVETVIPSTYCKDCEKQRVAESRRIHQRIRELPDDERIPLEAQMGGTCACCHKRKTRNRRAPVEYAGKLHAVCDICRAHLDEVGFDIAAARASWMKYFKHNAAEHQLDERWDAQHDRPRTSHGAYPRGRGLWRKATPEDVEDFYYDHIECVLAEKSWRDVLRWLNQRPEPKLATVTSINAT